MWESLVRVPRGSNNLRKFSRVLATFLVACFGYLFATSPTTYAADEVTWSGDSVVYQDHTYDRIDSNDDLPNDVKGSPAIYQYVDDTKNPNLVYFIYFANGVSNPKDEKEATYVRYTLNPPNRYINKTGEKKVTVVPVEAETPSEGDGTLTGDCTIAGIGYAVCPIMNGIAEGMDFVYKSIRGFLQVQPIVNNVDNPIYRIWVVMRDLANIAFVIGFLVIIYSYIAGGGFSGYEIRKILPRLVVAAVLINLSYVICALAVDVSNISGYSINQLFEMVRDQTLSGSDTGVTDINWTSVTSVVLAGGIGTAAGVALLPGATGATTIAGMAGGLWMLLAPFLFGGALLVMVTFFILAARQAIIFALIAIAPLAFAANILPNTEKWFEKWRSLFFTMLVMFPAFGAVFGAAELAGEAIIRMAKQTGSIEQVILGLGVMVAPLAITPLLLRLGGGILNRFGGIINNPRKGLYDRYKNYNKERLDERRAKAAGINADMLAAGGFKKRQFVRRRAATNFAKKNYRAEQKKQDEERAMNAWHRQTGRWGYDNNDKRDGDPFDSREANRGRIFRQPQTGYGNLGLYKKDNELQHNLTNAQHEEHWQHTLQHDPTRRGMLTDTRFAENRGKIMSGAMEAQDERTFQTTLNNANTQLYTDLKAMKVQTSVDTGVAEVQKAAIESAGKLALSNTIQGDQALITLKERTFANEKRAESIDTIIKTNAERVYVESSEGRTMNITTQAAQDRLEASKADEAAQIQEWRTREGAKNLTGQDATVAEMLRIADENKRIETQRLSAAKRKSDVEYALDLTETEVDPITGTKVLTTNAKRIVQRAGGIEGETGQTQARAVAFQTIVKAQNEGVAAAKTLLSRVDNDDLLGTGENGLDAPDILDRPTEHISAIASTIAGRMHQKSHIRLWDQMSILHERANNMVTAARATGDADAIADAEDKLGKIKDLQQQVMADKKRTPFGAGDRDQGQATTGDYEGNIYESTRARILTHMSGKRLSETDPDDLRLIFEMAREGKLNNAQLQKMAQSYKDWQEDDNLSSMIEDKHRFLLDPLAAYAATGDISRIPRPGERAPEGAAASYWDNQFDNINVRLP